MRPKLAAFLESIDPHYPTQTRVQPATDPLEPEAFAESLFGEFTRVVLVECDEHGDRHWVGIGQAMISRIFIDLPRARVSKTPRSFVELGVIERECHWLGAMNPTGASPLFHGRRGDRLSMDYVGEPVNRGNLPADWRRQARRILEALAHCRCSHNDIKCENLTVRDGRIFLIDFGWATKIGEPVPASWPKGIGRQHRVDVHVFDDGRAIFAALASAELNAIDRSIVMPPA